MTRLAAVETLAAALTAAVGAVPGDMTRLAAVETLAAATAAAIGAVAGDVARLAAVETLAAATATTTAAIWSRHCIGQVRDVQILAYMFNFTVTLA
jgi:hypothetical protein